MLQPAEHKHDKLTCFAGEFSQEYNGPREVGGIVKYMKAQVGPSSKECSSQADVDKLLKKDEVVVVSYLSDDSDHAEFKKAADSLRENVAFGHFRSSKDKKVRKRTSTGPIVCINLQNQSLMQ